MYLESTTVIDENELKQIIERCIRKDLNAQELLYRKFYSFCMGVCLRFSSNHLDARSIINDGFLKVFRNLNKLDLNRPFIPWLKTVMTNTAIDHYRAELRHSHMVDISDSDDVFESPAVENKLNYEELIEMIQQLPSACRTVFNLYAIDGYSHEEIARQLNITVGGSKSNLFKARKKLRDLLDKQALANENIIRMHNSGDGYLSLIK